MRPYATNERGGLSPDMTVYLYAYPQCSGAWRLLWAKPNAESFCHAEGECSAKVFCTMREAIAYGKRCYGETATKWRGFGYGFPQPLDKES